METRVSPKYFVNDCSIAASSSFTWLLISFRVTSSHVVFGLSAGFFLQVGLVQDVEYFPLQSFNWWWYLVVAVARGAQFQI